MIIACSAVLVAYMSAVMRLCRQIDKFKRTSSITISLDFLRIARARQSSCLSLNNRHQYCLCAGEWIIAYPTLRSFAPSAVKPFRLRRASE